ncbi:MAG: M56 family metallopeptidase [Sphingobacterium sp.]
MDALLIYFIQVNVLISVIYIGYYLFLRYLTFYRLNRLYFLIGLIFAIAYPFLDFGWLFPNEFSPLGQFDEYLPFLNDKFESTKSLTLTGGVSFLVGVGVIAFAGRFIFQILSILRVHYYSVDAKWQGFLFRNVVFQVSPFSFLKRIYVHIEQHNEHELRDIFEHEDIHVKGLHSVDIIVFEMLLIGCWYNPFVWLTRIAVRHNLEFLTDQQVLNKGIDPQTYQYSLLQVAREGTSVRLSNQFNFKLLKTRIMMMNKKRSSKRRLSNYIFLLPVIIFSAGAFTINRAEAQIERVVFTASSWQLNGDSKTFSAVPDTVVEPVVVQVKKKEGNLAKQQDLESPVEVVSASDTVPVKSRQEAFENSNILYIIDGERMGKDFKIETIDPNTIDSISVLKRKTARERFGDEELDGVMIIVLKK